MEIHTVKLHPIARSIFTGASLLSITLLLAGCSHIARKDGPPNYYVDETVVHDAVPKPEVIAKYGNMKSYVVFGKRYYVMKSSKDYEAVGTASWYGTQFHKHRTSSGEKYDMLGMTAAHKTLPLPTYVYVTNLKNQRAIIVKVNDRGPFESNRLIDLSYVAAKKLGMIGHGTANVRIQAIDGYEYAQNPAGYLAHLQGHALAPTPSLYAADMRRNHHLPITTSFGARTQTAYAYRHHSGVSSYAISEPQQSASTNQTRESPRHLVEHGRHFATETKQTSSHAVSSGNSAVYLQAGAFQHKSNAHQLKQHLASLVRSPVNIEAPSAKNHLYRVQIGPFSSHTEAESMTHHLAKLGIHTSRVTGA